MISMKTRAVGALATLAALLAVTDVAQAAAVTASTFISDRTGSLLTFSDANEYDVVATTKQQENTQFATVLPSVFLSDANGFSFAQVDTSFDPFPGTKAGAHDLGLGTSSVIWSFSYTATATGT